MGGLITVLFCFIQLSPFILVWWLRRRYKIKISHMIIIVGFSVLGLGFAVTQLSPLVSSWQLQQKHISQYGKDIMQACENPNLDTSGTRSISSNAKLLILSLDTNRAHVWHEQQSPELYPQSLDEVDFVVCASEQGQGIRTQVEQCDYFGGHTITRYRVHPGIVVLDPDTGETILAGTMVGTNPRECPREIYVQEGQSASDGEYLSSMPDINRLYRWLDGDSEVIYEQ